MTNQFALPILIFIEPSPWLAGGIIAVHLGAALALVAADLHGLIQCMLMLMVMVSLAHALLTQILQKHPDAPVQLLLTAGAEWWLTCVSGQTFAVQLMPAACVHPLLTVLSFQGEERRYTVILTPDVVDADMFRRLRVRLRFQHTGNRSRCRGRSHCSDPVYLR